MQPTNETLIRWADRAQHEANAIATKRTEPTWHDLQELAGIVSALAEVVSRLAEVAG